LFSKRWIPVIIIAVASLYFSCARDEEGEALAWIGDEAVTLQDLEARLEGMPPFMREQLNTPDGRDRLLKAIVEEEIIVRDAVDRGLDENESFKDEMARRRRDALVRLFYERVIEEESTPDAAEIASYYEDRIEEFTVPENIRGRHILVETEAEARSVRSQLEAGADFGDLARKKSLDSYTKDREGIIQGEIRRGKPIKMLGELPELVEVFFQLGEGELSQPVKTDKGYHIVRIDGRNPERVRSLDEVRADIASELTYENRNAVRDSILADLKSKYKVEFVSPSRAEPQTPEELFKIASEESDPELKVKYYTQFTEKFPDDERTYEAEFMIGFTMAEDMKDYDGAERVFRDFLEHHPDTDLSDDAQWMIDNMRSGKQPDFGSE
jgi:peptidyl-prolyl cis-trans isomerase C